MPPGKHDSFAFAGDLLEEPSRWSSILRAKRHQFALSNALRLFAKGRHAAVAFGDFFVGHAQRRGVATRQRIAVTLGSRELEPFVAFNARFTLACFRTMRGGAAA